MITRKLSGDTVKGREVLDQSDLITRPESLVILGEAGMGKTELTVWLNKQIGFVRCTARQLIRSNFTSQFGDASVLVIDALDEVSTRQEGEAVDLVLQALEALKYPRFILSCRAADWRSATAISAIKDHYPSDPLELYLEPFSDSDILVFLGKKLGSVRAAEVLEHFQTKRITDLLGNPQTLRMISEVAESGNLPDTVGSLFESFVNLAWSEHNAIKTNTALQVNTTNEVLDALGGGFAALILTGSDSLSRAPRYEANQLGDLHLADVAGLPLVSALPQVLDSRLVKPVGNDRFSYVHRRIGEFLGARWLAREANTERKRRRLLQQLHAYKLVPASLRGIHAWLAWHDKNLALSVISADPMGVIEYGDADNLSIEQGRTLIQSLEILASSNPRFLRGWDTYSLDGIIQPALIEELRRVITTADTSVGLQLLVLEAVVGSPVAPILSADLEKMLLDVGLVYSVRKTAGEALVKLDNVQHWPELLERLRSAGDDDSIQLAVSLLTSLGFNYLDDQKIVDIISAQAGLTICQIPRHAKERVVGLFSKFSREFPDNRLERILDTLSEFAYPLVSDESYDHEDLGDLVLDFVVRRINLGRVDPDKVWHWLELFDHPSAGARQSSLKQLADAFITNHFLRKAIQKKILLEAHDDKTIWQRSFFLTRRSSGLGTSTEDVIGLLNSLDPFNTSDENWRDIVTLARHSETEGQDIRDVARQFLIKRNANPESFSWLDNLTVEVVPEWKIREERRRKIADARREKEWNSHRLEFSKHIDKMRNGDYGSLVNPAKAYLKLFNDIGDDVPANERIGRWLGAEIANAAHSGFLKFLVRENPQPTAKEVAESFAKNLHWDASYIVVAGLAELYRSGEKFQKVSDEPMLVAFYELQQSQIDSHAEISGLSDAISDEIKRRGLWLSAIRGWIEPQLNENRSNVDGLYSLMRKDDSPYVTALASEWLEKYSNVSGEAELELIDRLIRFKEWPQLRSLTAVRRAVFSLSEERRRTWDAIFLLAEFEQASDVIQSIDVERELLWHLRARSGDNRNYNASVELTPKQLAWIIGTFRRLWPAEYRPSGVSSGDTNPWDASDYLGTLIARLGDQVSDEAALLLTELRDAPKDDYTHSLLMIMAEQEKKRVESLYKPATLESLSALVRDEAPVDAISLKAVVLEEIYILQHQLLAGGDPAEPLRGFYENGMPRDEEPCRDHLLLLLRGRIPFNIDLRPEAHAADDKEIDIACSLGPDLMIPIEVKGQWHPDLWTSADTQLARLYSSDWRADRRGIYLVLWFGDTGKKLKSPPKGLSKPTDPEGLRQMLIEQSQASKTGLVDIVVMDLTKS